MGEKTGYIYIFTNPSFPEYVKIGYAANVDERLKQLNRSECVPFAFRVYATCEVMSHLSDKKIHEIIDYLNPNLRSIENFNGRKRVREFYAMAPEDAYLILKATAEIHGCGHRLKLYPLTPQEKQDEEEAQTIDTEHQEKLSNFSFTKCGIVPGEQVEYTKDTSIKATVLNDRQIEYQGETLSMTALAKRLTGRKNGIAGPSFFSYNDEPLNALRQRLGV